jgi:hypothetical protein
MRDPPALERANAELERARRDLQDTQAQMRLIHVRDNELREKYERERELIRVVGRKAAAKAREAQLRFDLRQQEVNQIRTKAGLLEMTLRRARVNRDDRALRDALDMGRELGIPPGRVAEFG